MVLFGDSKLISGELLNNLAKETKLKPLHAMPNALYTMLANVLFIFQLTFFASSNNFPFSDIFNFITLFNSSLINSN